MSDTDFIIRDKVNNDLLNGVIPAVDCILNSECKWYSNDDESANEIADCMYEYIDYSDYTSDEFEYVLRWIIYFCGVKYAYNSGLLKKDDNGSIRVPKEWTKNMRMGI